MNDITIRRATESDFTTLAELRIRFITDFAGEQSAEAVDALRNSLISYFNNAMADNTCISYLATCNNIVAGVGSMVFREQPGNFKNPSGKVGYVMNMYTLPDFRKRGICTGILNALVDEGTKMGITAFELHATKEGEPLYLKNGFAFHHEPTLRKYISG